jgi:hypothetical protein
VPWAVQCAKPPAGAVVSSVHNQSRHAPPALRCCRRRLVLLDKGGDGDLLEGRRRERRCCSESARSLVFTSQGYFLYKQLTRLQEVRNEETMAGKNLLACSEQSCLKINDEWPCSVASSRSSHPTRLYKSREQNPPRHILLPSCCNSSMAAHPQPTTPHRTACTVHTSSSVGLHPCAHRQLPSAAHHRTLMHHA